MVALPLRRAFALLLLVLALASLVRARRTVLAEVSEDDPSIADPTVAVRARNFDGLRGDRGRGRDLTDLAHGWGVEDRSADRTHRRRSEDAEEAHAGGDREEVRGEVAPDERKRVRGLE